MARLRAIILPDITHGKGRKGRVSSAMQSGMLPPVAYVEFFKPSTKKPARTSPQSRTSFEDQIFDFKPEEGHLMHRFARDTWQRRRNGAFVPLEDIWRTVSMIPIFDTATSSDWTGESSMDLANHFLLNPYDTVHTFQACRTFRAMGNTSG